MNYEQAEAARKYINELMVNIANDLLVTQKSKPLLSDIVNGGRERIRDAVELVIARHEKELKAIENKAKAEKESALEDFYRSGVCGDGAHQHRMGALMENGHQQYLDSLVRGFGCGMLGQADPNPFGGGLGQAAGLYGII